MCPNYTSIKGENLGFHEIIYTSDKIIYTFSDPH